VDNCCSYFIGKYVVIVTELITELIEMAFVDFRRSVVFARGMKTEMYSQLAFLLAS